MNEVHNEPDEAPDKAELDLIVSSALNYHFECHGALMHELYDLNDYEREVAKLAAQSAAVFARDLTQRKKRELQERRQEVIEKTKRLEAELRALPSIHAPRISFLLFFTTDNPRYHSEAEKLRQAILKANEELRSIPGIIDAELSTEVASYNRRFASQTEERAIALERQLSRFNAKASEIVAGSSNSLELIRKTVEKWNWDAVGDQPQDYVHLGTLTYRITEWDKESPSDLEVPWILKSRPTTGIIIEGEPYAVQWLQMWVMGMLAAHPPGLLRLTLIDPDGLGKQFAKWLELGDSSANLLGGKIWTEPREIEARLGEIKHNIVRITQRILRDEHADLHAFNRANPRGQEPSHLVIIRQPVSGWNASTKDLIRHLFLSGPRCGIIPCIQLPNGTTLSDKDFAPKSFETLIFTNRCPKGKLLPMATSFPPSWAPLQDERTSNPAEFLRQIAAQAAQRAAVSIDYDALLLESGPLHGKADLHGTAEGIVIPLGRQESGAIQSIELGTAAQNTHTLIGGRTRSGKSTLMHALIATACRLHGPDELRLYLLDFKRGVEFMPYLTGRLPHAKVLSVESDREFGLSVLHELQRELDSRSKLFRKAGVDNLSAYRRGGHGSMPRLLLIIDEFQVLFGGEGRLASDACQQLESLLRQGGAFGLHVILATQSLQSGWNLPAAALSQISVRIALSCEERVSYQILGDGNAAAKTLSRPGEAIYNDKNGLPAANRRFQVVHLERESLPMRLEAIRSLHGNDFDCAVFDGRHLPNPMDHLLEFGPSDNGCVRLVPGLATEMGVNADIDLDQRKGQNLLFFSDNHEMRVRHWRSFLESLRFQKVNVSAVDGATGKLAIPPCIPSEPHFENLDRSKIAAFLNRARNECSQGSAEPRRVLIIHSPQNLSEFRNDSMAALTGGGSPVGSSASADFEWLLREGPERGFHTILLADRPSSLVHSIDSRSRLIECFDLRCSTRLADAESRRLFQSDVAVGLGEMGAYLYRRDEGCGLRYRPFDWTATNS